MTELEVGKRYVIGLMHRFEGTYLGDEGSKHAFQTIGPVREQVAPGSSTGKRLVEPERIEDLREV